MKGFLCEERLAWGGWEAMERVIARLFEHFGFKGVTIVGGAGDHGADIIGEYEDQRWVFQSKYRSNGSIGMESVQEPVRASSHYRADVAVAVTNRMFSESCYEYMDGAINRGIDLRLFNGDDLLDFYNRLDDTSAASRRLRTYQDEAVEAVEKARSTGDRRALVLMATGLGKSVVAYQVISNEIRRNPNQEVLVLAHRTSLIRQLERASWAQFSKHVSTHLWTDGEHPTYSGGVVFATYQSLVNHANDLAGRYGMVIVDEAHNAGAPEYQALLDRLQPNFMLALTATPWRGDHIGIDRIFGPPVFSMDIVEGMMKGFLAEVDYRLLTDPSTDWDEIKRLSQEGRSIKDLNRLLILPDRDVAMVDVVAGHFESTQSPKGIGFCRSIAHTEQLRGLFATRGIRTAVLHSELDRQHRFDNLSKFRNGEIDLLLSVDMLNEGIDVPDVNIVVFMRVTHSRRIFVQQLGRGLRLSDGKNKVLVLDFVADIRRLAQAVDMNRSARSSAGKPEIIRYNNGVVVFDNDKTADFFNEYLADVADISIASDSSTLRYPDIIADQRF